MARVSLTTTTSTFYLVEDARGIVFGPYEREADARNVATQLGPKKWHPHCKPATIHECRAYKTGKSYQWANGAVVAPPTEEN